MSPTALAMSSSVDGLTTGLSYIGSARQYGIDSVSLLTYTSAKTLRRPGNTCACQHPDVTEAVAGPHPASSNLEYKAVQGDALVHAILEGRRAQCQGAVPVQPFAALVLGGRYCLEHLQQQR